jgi:hypothetical protein
MPAVVQRLMRERGDALPPCYGKIEQPPNPPLGITLQQVEIVNRHLAKRKWTLVRNEDGFYRPQPIVEKREGADLSPGASQDDEHDYER